MSQCIFFSRQVLYRGHRRRVRVTPVKLIGPVLGLKRLDNGADDVEDVAIRAPAILSLSILLYEPSKTRLSFTLLSTTLSDPYTKTLAEQLYPNAIGTRRSSLTAFQSLPELMLFSF